MTTEPLQAEKNILGYQLQERIGSGGFGEVWSAIAPGGMRKAVKVVYGYHDEKRAQAELKALARVKEVRHPFLLSLERIEIYDGQLIVVTELADNSLADVFNQYTKKGETGIPREDLLRYIRSVADALDYLGDEHGLQHLDIKPDNLLMVSGHVKVADFGLIKDLQDASQSLMSGMTPAYASPELFDGRPGSKSDQYSLAIVYQEMLTGVRPFPGNTPAQLAAQHVHGKPNLSPLPQSDQAAIGKALSKLPADRYESCRELAEELANRKRNTKKAVGRIKSPGRDHADAESQTIQMPDCHSTAVVTSATLPLQASDLKTLEPPECDADAATVQPVLIVGIGSTANRVLKQVKKRILARHQSMSSVPAIRIACFDTDQNELANLCRPNDETAFSTEETLATPLSKPEAYRGQAGERLSWLSRRWIYNIPRSLQTEGLRPLGRLAFADHFGPICQRLETTLKEIVTPEQIATTAETLAMNPGTPQPRVVIVSSISGGVGSGMTLDLAYTVKLLMAEMGLQTNTVTGIMLHSSYQRTRDRGLASANAVAFLTELRHYVENGYPGEPTMGLPEFENEPPFDFAYYQELGNDLSQTDFDKKLSEIAEYIFLDTTSRCSVFFDSCREFEKAREHFSLRSFGLSVSGPGRATDGISAEKNLSFGLTQRWLNGHSPESSESSESSEISNNVAQEFEQLNLLAENQFGYARQFVEKTLGDRFKTVVADALNVAIKAEADRSGQVMSFLDSVVGCPPDRRNSSHADPELCAQFEKEISDRASTARDTITQTVSKLLDAVPLDLNAARTAVEAWKQCLEIASAEVKQVLTVCHQQTEIAATWLTGMIFDQTKLKKEESERLHSLVRQYCQLRREEFELRYIVEFYRVVKLAVAVVEQRVAVYATTVGGVGRQFLQEVSPAEILGSDSGLNMDSLMAEHIDAESEKLISQTETQIYENFVKACGGYPALLEDATAIQNRFSAEISYAAKRVLADAYKKISLEKIIAKNGLGLEQIVKWMTEKIRVARPAIDDCGGASRVLLGLPELTNQVTLAKIFQKQFGLSVKAVRGTCGDFVVCFEAEDLSLGNVVFRLLADRPDAIELVKRMHTRADVKWTSLSNLL